MSTIDVASLPVIDELFEEDYVLIQAKDRTGLIKFTDLVIGEQQVSFYKEIVDARTSINTLTTNLASNSTTTEQVKEDTETNTVNIAKNTADIANLDTTVDSLSADIMTSTQLVVDLDTAVQAVLSLTTPLNSQAGVIININQTLQDSITALATAVDNLSIEVNSMKATYDTSINQLNNQIFTINQRLDDGNL